MRAIAFINIRARVKNLKHWQPCHCLDTRKYYTHWQEWVALLLQLLCLTQVRWPEFPTRDKEVLKRRRKFAEKPLQSRQNFFRLKDRNQPLPNTVTRQACWCRSTDLKDLRVVVRVWQVLEDVECFEVVVTRHGLGHPGVVLHHSVQQAKVSALQLDVQALRGWQQCTAIIHFVLSRISLLNFA